MQLKHMALGALLSACLVTATLPALAADGVQTADSGPAMAAVKDSSGRWSHWGALVENQTISQATLDAIKSYLAENKPQRPAQSERPQCKSPFEQMVTDGVISQETHDAVLQYFSTQTRPEVGKRPSNDTSGRAAMLDSLLTAGVISQSEHDAMKAATPEKPTRDASSAPDSREDFEASKPSHHDNMLASMLEAGVITQSEYDTIKAAMPERPARTFSQAQ